MKGSTTRLNCNIVLTLVLVHVHSVWLRTIIIPLICILILILTQAISFYPIEENLYRGGTSLKKATEVVMIVVSNIWNFIMHLQ